MGNNLTKGLPLTFDINELWKYRKFVLNRLTMPVITIDILDGKTEKQKQQLVEKITDAVCEITQCPREVVTVIFHDIPRTNWGSGGKLKTSGPPQ